MKSTAPPTIRRFGTRTRRGMTLVEILVVVALIMVLTVCVVAGTNQLPSARLKGSATLVTSAIRAAYTRAASTSKSVRVVFDMAENKVWLEEGDLPMFVEPKDKTGTAGADPMTEAERAAVTEGEGILKKPPIPKPRFKPVDTQGFGNTEAVTLKAAKPLKPGIRFREVQTGHDDEPRKEGRAYLYFWPGGMTERASIQLRIGESEADTDTLSLVVSPLTGKVTVKTGPVPLVEPIDDATASERQDTR